MWSFEIVVVQEIIEVPLDIMSGNPVALSSLDPQKFIQDGPIQPLNEAIGPGRADLSSPVLDILYGTKQLIGMVIRSATERHEFYRVSKEV